MQWFQRQFHTGVYLDVYKRQDFAPGGLSGLALLGNYLWGFPIGITTLVLNVPLVLLEMCIRDSCCFQRTSSSAIVRVSGIVRREFFVLGGHRLFHRAASCQAHD